MSVNEQDRGPPGEAQEADAYFVVDSANDRWLVSGVMARHIEQMLDREPVPGWITFVDLFGARIRVRAVVIQSVAQSTGDQRAASRALSRRMGMEQDSD